eukprot:253120-Prymnesium_polylepis.1
MPAASGGQHAREGLAEGQSCGGQRRPSRLWRRRRWWQLWHCFIKDALRDIRARPLYSDRRMQELSALC